MAFPAVCRSRRIPQYFYCYFRTERLEVIDFLRNCAKRSKLQMPAIKEKAKCETVFAVAIAFRENTKSFDKSDRVFNKDALL
jgi:hypothetical protein